jgi:hypothetical protein
LAGSVSPPRTFCEEKKAARSAASSSVTIMAIGDMRSFWRSPDLKALIWRSM